MLSGDPGFSTSTPFVDPAAASRGIFLEVPGAVAAVAACPMVRDVNFNDNMNCTTAYAALPRVTSVEALQAATAPAYFSDGARTLVRAHGAMLTRIQR